MKKIVFVFLFSLAILTAAIGNSFNTTIAGPVDDEIKPWSLHHQ